MKKVFFSNSLELAFLQKNNFKFIIGVLFPIWGAEGLNSWNNGKAWCGIFPFPISSVLIPIKG